MNDVIPSRQIPVPIQQYTQLRNTHEGCPIIFKQVSTDWLEYWTFSLTQFSEGIATAYAYFLPARPILSEYLTNEDSVWQSSWLHAHK